MKNCLENMKNFYKKDGYDNLLKATIIALNTLNLFLFIESRYCVPISVCLLIIYYYFSKKKTRNKKILILTWITFSIFTILGESLIISSKTGISLNYNNSDIYNVSSWLFSAYASMVMAILFISEYYDAMLD